MHGKPKTAALIVQQVDPKLRVPRSRCDTLLCLPSSCPCCVWGSPAVCVSSHSLEACEL